MNLYHRFMSVCKFVIYFVSLMFNDLQVELIKSIKQYTLQQFEMKVKILTVLEFNCDACLSKISSIHIFLLLEYLQFHFCANYTCLMSNCQSLIDCNIIIMAIALFHAFIGLKILSKPCDIY